MSETIVSAAATGLPLATRLDVETEIERLIAFLDEIDGDPDLEDDDPAEEGGDTEPSLGWTYTLSGVHVAPRAEGYELDLEEQCEDEGGQCDDEGFPWGDDEPDNDGEHSLGWSLDGTLAGTSEDTGIVDAASMREQMRLSFTLRETNTIGTAIDAVKDDARALADRARSLKGWQRRDPDDITGSLFFRYPNGKMGVLIRQPAGNWAAQRVR